MGFFAKLFLFSLLVTSILWSAEPLRIGTDTALPPYTFKNAEGQTVGIEMDLARLVAKALHRPLRIKVLPFKKLFEALKNGEIDIIMAGLSITKPRTEKMLFTVPWWHTAQMALTHQANRLIPNPSSDGVGMRVGYLKGTTGRLLITRRFHKAKSFGFETIEEGIAALIRNQIDYLFVDAPTVWYYTSVHPLEHIAGWYLPYTDEPLAWALQPGQTALKKALDSSIQTWRQNGTIRKILGHWIPAAVVVPNPDTPIRFDR